MRLRRSANADPQLTAEPTDQGPDRLAGDLELPDRAGNQANAAGGGDTAIGTAEDLAYDEIAELRSPLGRAQLAAAMQARLSAQAAQLGEGLTDSPTVSTLSNQPAVQDGAPATAAPGGANQQPGTNTGGAGTGPGDASSGGNAPAVVADAGQGGDARAAAAANADPLKRSVAANDDSDFGGIAIALPVPASVAASLAVPDGVDPADMHVTLAFVACDTDGVTGEMLGQLVQAVSAFTVDAPPVTGETTGFGLFMAGDDATRCVGVALVDSPELADWKRGLHWALSDFGIPEDQTHGFIPHITLGYGDAASLSAQPLPPSVQMTWGSVVVMVGVTRIVLPLLGPEEPPIGGSWDGLVTRAVQDDELRYTFAPLYCPELDDSWGERASADDLRRMAWDYFSAVDKRVYLQHVPGETSYAGKVVDQVVWPFDHQGDMVTGDGITRSVRIPAGTVYQGIVWEPWAYGQIKSGNVNGLSFGAKGFKRSEGGE